MSIIVTSIVQVIFILSSALWGKYYAETEDLTFWVVFSVSCLIPVYMLLTGQAGQFAISAFATLTVCSPTAGIATSSITALVVVVLALTENYNRDFCKFVITALIQSLIVSAIGFIYRGLPW